ncbi:MAG: glucans biosynthesis glucosyltransferase MdoH [Deltaproteobacteria bacterium]|jgi:membrane glycosyltransferase|nr:glucans biosynthesis glucosyltransferase MdoH [Deltaproteobacteria bacterium]
MKRKNPENSNPPYKGKGALRRTFLLLLIVCPAAAAANVMRDILPEGTEPALGAALAVLFGVLFAWISAGFWSSLAGFFLLTFGKDKRAILEKLPRAERGAILPRDFKTAILFPVYNEDPFAVAAGIRTTREALRKLGEDERFDVFVLSDSNDADVFCAEEECFLAALKEDARSGAGKPGAGEGKARAEETPEEARAAFRKKGGGLYYRRREHNVKKKSGNVGDFLRRWGAHYRYMVIFDADSLMSAEALVRLVLSMEKRPDAGIIQTPPKAIFGSTPLARAQQFANHCYGPIFAAGLHWWQLGDAQYWGHNAIIRVKPFTESCGLPRLKGSSALGGEILSHDFVESALMRRAGYGVWLAHDLEGSHEMTPPTLNDELVRDRRWCRGNLQHAKLLFAKGFFPTHRALFVNGIMSYGSALLWFLFLLVSTVEALSFVFSAPSYFPEGRSLFPDWPRYFPGRALALLSGTGALLLFPKLLSLLYQILAGKSRLFGGPARMFFSMLAELLLSTLLAPVRMLFHSWFVVSALIGTKVGWNPQNRESGGGVSFRRAFGFYFPATILGVVWGLSMFLFSPGFFLWLSPVAAGLALSVPLAMFAGGESWGKVLRKTGLFRTPPELEPAREIKDLLSELEKPRPRPGAGLRAPSGFARTVATPELAAFHARHFARSRKNSRGKTLVLNALLKKAMEQGPDASDNREKRLLLSDEKTFRELSSGVWRLDADKASLWGL